MLKVRTASNADYYDTGNRFISDGLSFYYDTEEVEDGYPNRLQYTRNNQDIWLVSYVADKPTLFFINKDPDVGSECDMVSTERFVEFVIDITPDAFDWCLFHLFSDSIEIEVSDD